MFTPRVTVACVIQADDKFLLVEERIGGKRVFNQPAGHLEQGESLPEACRREVLEETGLDVTPQGLVGVYLYPVTREQLTFLRFCFFARLPTLPAHAKPLDHDIIATHWFSHEEIRQRQSQLRSSMVITCIDAYLAGERIDIERIHSLIQ